MALNSNFAFSRIRCQWRVLDLRCLSCLNGSGLKLPCVKLSILETSLSICSRSLSILALSKACLILFHALFNFLNSYLRSLASTSGFFPDQMGWYHESVTVFKWPRVSCLDFVVWIQTKHTSKFEQAFCEPAINLEYAPWESPSRWWICSPSSVSFQSSPFGFSRSSI